MKIAALALALAATCSAMPYEPRSFGSPYDPIFPYDFGIRRLPEEEDTHKSKSVKKSHAKVVKNVSNKKEPSSAKVDDYDAAENRVFKAVEGAEKKVLHAAEEVEHWVEHAVHDEVDTLFHEREKHEAAENVSVKKGEKKPAFVRGKEGKDAKKHNKHEEEKHHHHHHEFKPEVEECLRECMSGDME